MLSEDFITLGFKLHNRPKSIIHRAMANTGCQSCLAGIRVVHRLGLSTGDLIPVTMQMHAANNNGIKILGALVLCFSGMTKGGARLETRQLVYITDTSDRLFLSKEPCITIGMISTKFPTIGEIKQTHHSTQTLNAVDTLTHNESCLTTPCECPRRQLPPAPPTELPFPATEENCKKLQEYLLEYYKSSSFNTCQHQTQPMMEGPPLKLMVDPGTVPVAHHTPVPVPLHWQDEIKAGLDQDVKLGVIELVPIGEPVTWCHHMVICAKKNGNPVAQWTSNLSTKTPSEKPITPNHHSTRLDLYHMTR